MLYIVEFICKVKTFILLQIQIGLLQRQVMCRSKF